MSKNILITEGRRGRRFGSVKKMKTRQQGGGSCLWVPEDDVQLEPLFVAENGTFRPEEYGFSEASVHVVDGNIGNLNAYDNLAFFPEGDINGYGKVKVDVPASKYNKYSETLQMVTLTPDPNYEYHFSINGTGGEYYEENGGWFREWSNYQLIVDSHLPFYIKRFDIPVYYYDHSNTRIDTTFTLYAVRPYVRRNGGPAVGTGNYRLRLMVDGHYRSTYPEDVYGPRDESMSFDGEIICPASSSSHSKWSSNDGSALHFYAWDQEDPELEFSDTESYVSLSWYDGTILQQYLDSSPYEVKNKYTYIYSPMEMIIGETVYGEAPRTEMPFGNIEYYYNTPLYYGSAGINFGNNPLFTGTYNEYRTYIEQNFGQ